MSTKPTVIRIPTHMRPQPWKHLLCWLLRTTVPTHDYVESWAARNANERSDKHFEMYMAEVNKREDLAAAHSPKLAGPSYPRNPLSCTKCPHFWPCPTYRWATEQPNLKVTFTNEPEGGE